MIREERIIKPKINFDKKVYSRRMKEKLIDQECVIDIKQLDDLEFLVTIEYEEGQTIEIDYTINITPDDGSYKDRLIKKVSKALFQ